MKESSIQKHIRAALCQGSSRVYRNNIGLFFSRSGEPVRCGLFPGSSDLIGWQTVTITPEMVGTRVAVFLSVEVKRPGNKTRKPEQDNWINAVNAAGGIAGYATSVQEARSLLS